MESTLIKTLADYGVGLLVVCVGGWYIVRYFQAENKRILEQNQANLDKFIDLVQQNIVVNTKVSEMLSTIHPKLNEMHDDIKLILPKTRSRKTL